MNSHIEPGDIPDMNTLEIAQIYEKQGYAQDAHRIYAALDALESTPETRAGLNRTLDFKTVSEEIKPGETRLRALLEEWVVLLNATYRINNYKKLKTRLLSK
ncbi:MAG: hypothetical protein KKE62_10960 [Proteobacteria bacterium]|nr:hypothetical protein [Pseudomonadota bacterium]MBU1389124.1 hypothetical protein [Pseudomonadota bacterium]MBU1543348.1 hypothetical protein [Pseudomonadota bacterium]MBU2480907.1 hypothetical protein [Pseudomonadota bacterium]